MDFAGLLQAHAPEAHDRIAERLVGLCALVLGREDEAVDVAAEAHGVKPERPVVAARARGCRREAVDGRVLDAGLIDVLDPARLEISGQRLLGRHADDVESQGFAAAVLEAEHRLRGVVEREARRRREGEGELGMQEAAAAHESFARVLAEHHAVEVVEIGAAVARAGARSAELAGVNQCVLDALGGRWMRRQEVERALIGVAAGRLEIGVALHAGEEARGAERIEAGAGRHADADAVGLELLRAREGGQSEFGLRQRQRAGVGVAEHVVDDVADDRRLPRLLFSDGGVVRDDMAHLVRQHRGELGLVVGERDQAARDVELAVRQGKGVDRRRVENGDLVFQVGTLGGGDQPLDGLLDQRLQPRVLVGAAVGRQDARVLALGGGRPRRLGGGGVRHRQRHLLLVRRAGAAGEQQQRERGNERARPPVRLSCYCRQCCRHGRCSKIPQSASSICSGAVASMIGPERCSTKPRTRIRRPSSVFGSSPAAVKARACRRKIVTVKSRVQRRPKFT